MELRVLKYFLVIAKEENITKAAQLLHISQPALSRQLLQLEEELGVTLFQRSRHRVILTEDGLLLRKRAEEIVNLTDKTEQEFQHRGTVSGTISIGCGETVGMLWLAEQMRIYQQKFPLVQYQVYTATADYVKEQLEKGILDLGLLTEPVYVNRYERIRMPEKNRWGILVRKDSPIAKKEQVRPEELTEIPLLISQREMVKDGLKTWFGALYRELRIVATFDLLLNAAAMVKQNLGAALCVDLIVPYDQELRFIPLSPKLETGSVLIWKPERDLTVTVRHFIEQIKNAK